MDGALLPVQAVLARVAADRLGTAMTLKELQDKRLELAAESHDLEARLKAIRHQLVDVCDAIEQHRERKEDAENACACGATEDELNAAGRQLYVCDVCDAWCCSEHSENGLGTTLYCDECTGGRLE